MSVFGFAVIGFGAGAIADALSLSAASALFALLLIAAPRFVGSRAAVSVERNTAGDALRPSANASSPPPRGLRPGASLKRSPPHIRSRGASESPIS
jgi:hypothetical protein